MVISDLYKSRLERPSRCSRCWPCATASLGKMSKIREARIQKQHTSADKRRIVQEDGIPLTWPALCALLSCATYTIPQLYRLVMGVRALRGATSGFSFLLVFAHFILTANNLPSSKLLLNHVHWSAHMLGATADGAAALVECSREERLGTAVSGVMKLSVSQLAIWMISHRALPKLQRWNASLSKRLPEVMFRWLFWQGGLTVRVRVPPPYLCSQTSR